MGKPALSQDDVFRYSGFKTEQKKFLQQIRGMSNDTSIVHPITRYVDFEVTNIHRSLIKDRKLKHSQKEKALRSVLFFMTELGRKLQYQQIEVFDVPEALESYKKILFALNRREELEPLLSPLSPRIIEIMTVVFAQYDEYNYLDDVAVYKRVASSPEFILNFLESKPGFRFLDSLLVTAAMHDPMRIVYYLNKRSTAIHASIRSSENEYLRQIVSISENKNASELLPFLPQLLEGKLTPAGILTTRTKVTEYFQMLVNTLSESIRYGDYPAKFLKPLRNGIRQKSLSFYVNQVNELHDAGETVRFASVKDLRPEDIYYIITSTGEDLYTSSYLGLYKRLKSHFTDQNLDSLFYIVQYDNFHVFMRLAANYNVLADFLKNMPVEKSKMFLNRFMSGIGEDSETGLDRAMDIGDSFGSLKGAPDLIEHTEAELRSNLRKSIEKHQYRGIRLYNILLQVLELVKHDGALSNLWAKLGNYETLERNKLMNDQGEIVELVLFYGDEDGAASFRNFIRSYTDSNNWKITRNQHWVSIHSVSEQPLIIYANLPLDISKGLDLVAQDSLLAFMEKESHHPAIVVHRGHSYHLDKTLKRLRPSVNLAILGSCGSYNNAISIAHISPDVHVIGSKKMGSKSINDPMIEVINNYLINMKDLLWSDVWKQLNDRFSKDVFTLSLFNEYFPPAHNMGLFVLKLFKSGNM